MERLRFTFLDEWSIRRFLKARIGMSVTGDLINELISEVYNDRCVDFVYHLLVGDLKHDGDCGDIYETMRKIQVAEDIAQRFKRLGDGVQTIGIINLDPISYMTEPSHNKELQKLINFFK